MAFGEGANWEGTTHIIAGDGVTFEVHVASTPMIGAVRVRFEIKDTPADIATNLAKEWNERQPIKNVFAVAEPGSGLTAFFLTGPLADGTHEIKSMAATFDGQPREEMPQVGGSVSSFLNSGVSVTRTAIQVNSAATSSG
jgi:hypothetical protein